MTASRARIRSSRSVSGMVLLVRSTTTAEQMEQPAELTVGVAPARLELDGEHGVLRIGAGAIPGPAVGEEPDPVPGDRINVARFEHRRQMVDAVGSRVEAQTVDLMVGVERMQGRDPVTFQCR